MASITDFFVKKKVKIEEDYLNALNMEEEIHNQDFDDLSTSL